MEVQSQVSFTNQITNRYIFWLAQGAYRGSQLFIDLKHVNKKMQWWQNVSKIKFDVQFEY
jgi:hypothetical protein